MGKGMLQKQTLLQEGTQDILPVGEVVTLKGLEEKEFRG